MTIEVRKLKKRDNRKDFRSGEIEIDRFLLNLQDKISLNINIK